MRTRTFLGLTSAVIGQTLHIEERLQDTEVESLGELKLTCKIRGAEKFQWLNEDQPVATDDNSLTIKTTLVNKYLIVISALFFKA